MAKVLITGCREYGFDDDKSGRRVEGLSIYFKEKLESRDGMKAAGYATGKLSVKKGTDLFDRMISLGYEKPFEAEAVYEITPGRRQAVLSDIQF